MLTSFWKGISDNLRKVVTLDADRPELIIDVELDVVQAHAQLSPCCPTKPTPQRHLDSFSLTLSQTLPPTSVCFRASLGPELLKEAGAWASKSWTYGMSIGTSNIHLCLVSSRQIMLLLQLFPPPGIFQWQSRATPDDVRVATLPAILNKNQNVESWPGTSCKARLHPAQPADSRRRLPRVICLVSALLSLSPPC